MKPELAFLMDEIEESLQEAYDMGLKEGGQPNKAILDTKRDMLAHFDVYLSKYRRLEDDDGELIFIHKGYEPTTAITLGTLITNFLLSYDDE